MELTLEELVLAMGDQHIPHLSERMERITLSITKDNAKKIKHIIFMGDGVDNPAMSEFPERPDNDHLLQKELDEFVIHAEKYRKIVPNAKFYYINGNHCKGRLDRVKNLNRSLAGLRNLDFENLIKESCSKYAPKLSFSFHDTLRLKGINFSHGDKRIDPYIKEGVHGTANTARLYPFEGPIVTAHGHTVDQIPRPRGDCSCYRIGAMFDIDELAKQYRSFHGYQNGFMIIRISGEDKQFDNLLVPKGEFIYGERRYK
jgi:hypothetical protein